MNKSIISSICLSVLAGPTLAHAIASPFGSNVFVFDPTMKPSDINSTISQIYNKQRFNEFGDERYAFLFMPGKYGDSENIDVKVGFYTHVAGLGETPNDVVIKGAVRTQDRPPGDNNHPEQGPGALTNFWRGVENLAIIPTLGSMSYPNAVPKDQNVWAVSQATFLRRIRIMNGSLRLYDLGYASGGYLADSRIDNKVISGTQQQWLTRNTQLGSWEGSNWNMVFTGVKGSIPTGTWPNPPYTVVEKSPLVREKSYLYFDKASNQFALKLRTLRRNIAGTDWHIEGTSVPMANIYVAKPGVSAADINLALTQFKYLILTPGVYHLSDTIKVTRPNTVIFGMGLPSLVSDTGKPAMVISDVDGVQVSGVLFDAGPVSSVTLLQVGEPGNTQSHAKNPTFLYDIFCRVGGINQQSKTQSCATINSNDVVGDNLWFWRADHGANVGWDINKGDNGITVNGNNVVIYNLMVEHFQKYQTIWNGDNGKVFEYQCEIPYDVPSQDKWKNGAINGYAAYKIGNSVNTHQALGLGVYTYFRDGSNVYLDSAIEAPQNKSIDLQHMILFWLSGNNNTGIWHVVNNVGAGISQSNRRSNLSKWP